MMNKTEETKKIRTWISHACNCCGCPELVHKIKIIWNARITTKHGRAWSKGLYYRSRLAKKPPTPKNLSFQDFYVVEFSEILWPTSKLKLRKQTAIHETCHIIDYYLNCNRGCRPSRNSGYKPHGPRWRALMEKCGVSPDRCFKLEDAVEDKDEYIRQHLSRRRSKTLFCPCTMHKVSNKVYQNVKTKRRGYICRMCKSVLQITNPAAPNIFDTSTDTPKRTPKPPKKKFPKVPKKLRKER